MDYHEYGYGYDSEGNPIGNSNNPSLGKKDIKGWGSLILVLGIGVALYSNGAKWKRAVFNYYLNLFHHPLQIFHFETLVYILITLFFIRLAIIVFKKIFI